ncbi:MAG: Rrf2 family transcriptional regulator [Candidatus Cloacimonetes bacterium]|nr:Rrf2 family transcriptional regulator [Candidatus Cloacimonadota bacterium]
MAGAKATVLAAMKQAATPLKASEIAELCRLDKKTVDKAMKELKKDEAITSPKRCYWQAK